MEEELRKQMIQRNFVFWGKLAEKYIMIVLGIILCYVFFFSYIGRSDLLFSRDIWSVLFTYQMVLMLISALIAPMSYGMAYIPLVISFGSKRTEAVWGLQFMNWLILVEMGALLLLFAGLSSVTAEQIAMVAGIALVGGIAGVTLGQFATAAGFHFGMKGIWVTIVIIVVLLVVVSATTVLFVLREDNFIIEGFWIAIGAAVTVVLYAGSLFLLLRVVRNYEVRR